MGIGNIDDDILESLGKILGEKNLFTSGEELEKYSYDETSQVLKALPEIVVKPSNTTEVSKVLNIANEKKISITPRGQETGLCSGAARALSLMPVGITPIRSSCIFFRLFSNSFRDLVIYTRTILKSSS